MTTTSTTADGTTTIEALWQGVPVISLAGRPSVGRFGACILHDLGLDDWVAADTPAYVARAVAAAGDLAALAQLRATLRQRFKTSSIYDAKGLATELETQFRLLSQGAASAASSVFSQKPDFISPASQVFTAASNSGSFCTQ